MTGQCAHATNNHEFDILENEFDSTLFVTERKDRLGVGIAQSGLVVSATTSSAYSSPRSSVSTQRKCMECKLVTLVLNFR